MEIKRMARKGMKTDEERNVAREEADIGGSQGHLHAKFTWVVSIIVNFPSEVIARKRPWRMVSHFSKTKARTYVTSAICPSCVSIRTRNVPRAAINQNLGELAAS